MIKVPFPGFVLSKHSTFWDSKKEYETQTKGSKSKRTEKKRRGKEQEKGLNREMAKTKNVHASN